MSDGIRAVEASERPGKLEKTLRQGYFQSGGRPGPGRPRGSIRHEFLRALQQTVTKSDWVKICEKAVAQAVRGDSAARAWLGRYLLGSAEATDWLLRHESTQQANAAGRIRVVEIEVGSGVIERLEAQSAELLPGEPGESGGTS